MMIDLVFYVTAVIAGLLLLFFFQTKEESANSCSSQEPGTPSKTCFNDQPSILTLLGLHDSSSNRFYAFEDHFKSFKEVSRACQRAGLEKCQLIIGVDFTASNEWQGRKSFNGQNLHKVVSGRILNPYQKVISIIGETLEPFDSDHLIPAYGFGDTQTLGHSVFPFNSDDKPLLGFTDVLEKYNKIATDVVLSGPTNFAPLIYKAIEIVKSRKSYHILIIIADGQVTEEQPTINAIVKASSYPLSIIVVGVGDGPWDTMEEFDNELPRRKFDNFQFVNYHHTTSKAKHPDTAFALHALMEIPDQYKTIKILGYLDIDACIEDDMQNGIDHTMLTMS